MTKKITHSSYFIPYQTIEEIRSQLDIIEVITEYLPLPVQQKNGKYLTVCPFHKDTAPSLCINIPEQFFYCFGCKANGTAINFVQKMEKLDYYQAVEFLVKKYNIPVTLQFKDYTKYYKTMEIMIAETQKRYSDLDKNFFKERYITEESRKKFEIGSISYYGRETLFDSNVKDFLDLGILKRKPHELGFDCLFSNRIMFPIRSEQGKPVSFMGRTLTKTSKNPTGKQVRKYIILPDNILFQKSKILYGLNLAKEYIKKNGVAIIVEGIIDVVTLSQIGIYSAVSSLGTRITLHQAKLLKKYTDKVIIMYDGDDAGIMSTFEIIPILIENGLEVEVCILPNKEDPDSYIKTNGKEAFFKLLKSRYPLIQFWKKYYTAKCDTLKKKKKFVDNLNWWLMRLKDDITRQLLIKDIETITGITLGFIAGETRRFINHSSTDEEEILKVFINNEDKKEYILNNLNPDFLLNQKIINIFKVIRSLHKGKYPLSVISISDHIEDEDIKQYFAKISSVEFKVSPEILKQLGEETVEKRIDNILFELHKRNINLQIEKTMDKIKNTSRGEVELAELLEKKKFMEKPI